MNQNGTQVSVNLTADVTTLSHPAGVQNTMVLVTDLNGSVQVCQLAPATGIIIGGQCAAGTGSTNGVATDTAPATPVQTPPPASAAASPPSGVTPTSSGSTVTSSGTLHPMPAPGQVTVSTGVSTPPAVVPLSPSPMPAATTTSSAPATSQTPQDILVTGTFVFKPYYQGVPPTFIRDLLSHLSNPPQYVKMMESNPVGCRQPTVYYVALGPTFSATVEFLKLQVKWQ